MKKILDSLIFVHIIAVAAVAAFFLILAWVEQPPARHNICTVAEISPDITPQERERCRQIRGHKL